MNYQAPLNQNNSNRNSVLSEKMKMVMNFANENGEVTEADIQSLLNVKRTRACEIAKSLCDKGLLYVCGRGANKKYLLVG